MASADQRRDGSHHGNLRETLIEVTLTMIAERGLAGSAIAELARAGDTGGAAQCLQKSGYTPLTSNP